MFLSERIPDEISQCTNGTTVGAERRRIMAAIERIRGRLALPPSFILIVLRVGDIAKSRCSLGVED